MINFLTTIYMHDPVAYGPKHISQIHLWIAHPLLQLVNFIKAIYQSRLGEQAIQSRFHHMSIHNIRSLRETQLSYIAKLGTGAETIKKITELFEACFCFTQEYDDDANPTDVSVELVNPEGLDQLIQTISGEQAITIYTKLTTANTLLARRLTHHFTERLKNSRLCHKQLYNMANVGVSEEFCRNIVVPFFIEQRNRNTNLKTTLSISRFTVKALKEIFSQYELWKKTGEQSAKIDRATKDRATKAFAKKVDSFERTLFSPLEFGCMPRQLAGELMNQYLSPPRPYSPVTTKQPATKQEDVDKLSAHIPENLDLIKLVVIAKQPGSSLLEIINSIKDSTGVEPTEQEQKHIKEALQAGWDVIFQKINFEFKHFSNAQKQNLYNCARNQDGTFVKIFLQNCKKEGIIPKITQQTEKKEGTR